MAYTPEDYQVRVDGTLGASEAWANTWTFVDLSTTGDIQDVIDALHAFYTSIKADHWTADVSAVSATWRNLDGSDSGSGDWATITGTNSGALLPLECAIRVSLSRGSVRGGPFLTGFRSGDLTTTGNLTAGGADDLADYVETLATFDVGTWAMAIDSPTNSDTHVVSRIRVGEVFDVIRRRRNNLPENYHTRSV